MNVVNRSTRHAVRGGRAPRSGVGMFVTPLLFAIATSVAQGAEGLARAGEPAPPLAFEALLHGPKDAKCDWLSLRGKVVVLEFWDTRCTPCVAAIERLNKIEEQYADRAVVFISITRESPAKVRKFLKERPIKGWIAIDKDGATFDSFGVKDPPATVLIDKTGRIAGFTHPYSLIFEPGMIKQLLAGTVPDALRATARSRSKIVDLFADVPDLDATPGAPQPICQVVIRPTLGNSGLGGDDSRGIRFDDVDVESIIRLLWKTPEPQIIFAMPRETRARYDVIARCPNAQHSSFREALQQLVKATFDLEIRGEVREMDVYVLTVPGGAEPRLTRSLGAFAVDSARGLIAPNPDILRRMQGGEQFFFVTHMMSGVAGGLANSLGRPVVDETYPMIDKKAVYALCVPYNPPHDSPEDLIQRIKSAYGLNLKPARREIDVLVVKKRGSVP